MSGDETPRPPATAEFGFVEQGGPSHAYPPSGDATIVKFTVGRFDNNVYVVASRSTGEALLVDAAAEPERILAECAGLHVTAILQTHGHADHVGALREVAEATGAPVYAHPDDATMLPVEPLPLSDGEILRAGEVAVEVRHTPGHTPGSLCYLVGGHLLSGDTLFPGGPGNTFGDPEAFATIMRSLDERLFTLPDSTRVSPGHGLDTTLGRERPHLETWRARRW